MSPIYAMPSTISGKEKPMEDVIEINGVQYHRVGSEEELETVRVIRVVPHYTDSGRDYVSIGLVRIKPNMNSNLLNPEKRTMLPLTHLNPGDRIMIIKK